MTIIAFTAAPGSRRAGSQPFSSRGALSGRTVELSLGTDNLFWHSPQNPLLSHLANSSSSMASWRCWAAWPWLVAYSHCWQCHRANGISLCRCYLNSYYWVRVSERQKPYDVQLHRHYSHWTDFSPSRIVCCPCRGQWGRAMLQLALLS